MTSRAAIDAFAAAPALAIVGVSRSGKKFGNYALRTLLAKGKRVYPIHPSATQIDGITCYPGFDALPEPVAAAVIVVPPAQGAAVVRDAAQAGIRSLWLQQGADSPEVLEACRQAGIDAIAGECILMFSEPKGVHRLHRWVRRVAGGLPK